MDIRSKNTGRMDMDFKDWIYTVMVASQMLMALRVRQEGEKCGWTRQARWIAKRMTAVTLSTILMTVLSWKQFNSGDRLLEWILTVGMIAMTLVMALNLPAILHGMTDERIGEDLNIRMDENES